MGRMDGEEWMERERWTERGWMGRMDGVGWMEREVDGEKVDGKKGLTRRVDEEEQVDGYHG